MTTEPHFPHAPATRHGRSATSSRVRQPSNGLGIAGFVVGLIGLAVAAIPLIGIVASPLVVAGLVLSIMGLSKVKKSLANNKGMAIAGIVLSSIGIVLCVAWLLFTTVLAGTISGSLNLPAVSGDKHQVEFVVTSTGGATVRYGSPNDQRTEVAPASTDAWRTQGSYNGSSVKLTLTADAKTSGVISCSIVVDGKKLADESGSTIALCTANID